MSFRELRSVDDITAYYRHGSELYGLESPRTMGYQTAPVDDRLIKHLLPENVPDSYSVLDIGCGLGQIVPILSDRFPKSHLETLLGIDLVDDFIQHCVAEFPAHEFAKHPKTNLQKNKPPTPKVLGPVRLPIRA